MNEVYIPKHAYFKPHVDAAEAKKPAQGRLRSGRGGPGGAGARYCRLFALATPLLASTAARCSAHRQASTRRCPALVSISIDLTGICSQITPAFLSTRRTAPVVVSSGTITNWRLP